MSGQHPHPEALYYHIAGDACAAGLMETDEFKRKQLAATAMVFSALCLEVFINQEFAAFPETSKLLDEDDRLPLETKWLLLPMLLGSVGTFDKSQEPFQTFRELLRTRNQRLVHFKPAKETGGGAFDRKHGYFGDLVNNVALAKRFCACIGEMIRELNRLTAGKTDVPSFLAGDRYISRVWFDVTMPIEWRSERSGT